MTRIRRTSVDLVTQLQGMIDDLYRLSTSVETDVMPDRLQDGTVAGHQIVLDDDGTGASILRSNNYNGTWTMAGLNFDGTQGWAIHSSGDAEFNDVLMRGTIVATSGTIGGFTIDATEGLYAGSGATRVQMKPGAGFWAGATTQAGAPFYVTADGNLFATEVSLYGGLTLLGSGAFRTAVSGQRIEMSAAGVDVIVFYNSAGTAKGWIYGTSSGVDLAVSGGVVSIGATTSLSVASNGQVVITANGSTILTLDSTIAASAVLNMGGNQINMGTARIVNLADPTGAQNAMTKAYADAHYVAI